MNILVIKPNCQWWGSQVTIRTWCLFQPRTASDNMITILSILQIKFQIKVHILRLYITKDFHMSLSATTVTDCSGLVCQLMNNAFHINCVQSLLYLSILHMNWILPRYYVIYGSKSICQEWSRTQIIIIMNEAGVSVTRMAIHLTFVTLQTNRLD